MKIVAIEGFLFDFGIHEMQKYLTSDLTSFGSEIRDTFQGSKIIAIAKNESMIFIKNKL